MSDYLPRTAAACAASCGRSVNNWRPGPVTGKRLAGPALQSSGRRRLSGHVQRDHRYARADTEKLRARPESRCSSFACWRTCKTNASRRRRGRRCNGGPQLSDELTPEVAQQFLLLLSQPGRLGKLLRRLHEVGVLEKIIPAFTHARCLLQFNEYHRFTVDEHSILAVERATGFQLRPGLAGPGLSGHQAETHAAPGRLLIHDLGKGFVEDHSEVGLRIAEETARRPATFAA